MSKNRQIYKSKYFYVTSWPQYILIIKVLLFLLKLNIIFTFKEIKPLVHEGPEMFAVETQLKTRNKRLSDKIRGSNGKSEI